MDRVGSFCVSSHRDFSSLKCGRVILTRKQRSFVRSIHNTQACYHCKCCSVCKAPMFIMPWYICKNTQSTNFSFRGVYFFARFFPRNDVCLSFRLFWRKRATLDTMVLYASSSDEKKKIRVPRCSSRQNHHLLFFFLLWRSFEVGHSSSWHALKTSLFYLRARRGRKRWCARTRTSQGTRLLRWNEHNTITGASFSASWTRYGALKGGLVLVVAEWVVACPIFSSLFGAKEKSLSVRPQRRFWNHEFLFWLNKSMLWLQISFVSDREVCTLRVQYMANQLHKAFNQWSPPLRRFARTGRWG